MIDHEALHNYIIADIKKRYPDAANVASNRELGFGLRADLSFSLNNHTSVIVEIKTKRVSVDDLAQLNLFRSVSATVKDTRLLLYGSVFPFHVREIAQHLGIELITIPHEYLLRGKADPTPGHMIKITTPSAWRVVHHFMVKGSSSINEAAKAAMTSYSWAHRVVEDLQALNLIERKGRSLFKLIDLSKLLNGIAWERPLKELVVKEWQASSSSLTEVLHDIADVGAGAVLTGYLAVQEYHDIARRVDLVQVYCNDLPDIEQRLGSSKDGIKVVLLRPDRKIEGLISGRLGVEGVHVVSKEQLVLDLCGLGFAAQDILRQLLGGPDNEPDDPVFERSEEELRAVAKWYAQRHPRDEQPVRLLLVGGWAVWCYNPYYPSIDIDIVASSRTRSSLFNELRKKRAFDKGPSLERNTTVFMLPFGGKEIVIDYDGPNTPGEFKGRPERLSWSHAFGNHKVHPIGEGYLPIPERGILLLSKLKAITDRTWDLGHEPKDPVWLTGKLAKDRADVLALLDPAKGGHEIDLGAFGALLGGLPFLVSVLRSVPTHPESYERYGTDKSAAVEWVERLLSLVGTS